MFNLSDAEVQFALGFCEAGKVVGVLDGFFDFDEFGLMFETEGEDGECAGEAEEREAFKGGLVDLGCA